MLCGMRVDRPVTGIAIGYGESNPARTFVIARWHSACDRLAYVAARAPVLVSGLVKAQARGRNSNKGATLRLGLRPEAAGCMLCVPRISSIALTSRVALAAARR